MQTGTGFNWNYLNRGKYAWCLFPLVPTNEKSKLSVIIVKKLVIKLKIHEPIGYEKWPWSNMTLLKNYVNLLEI